MKNVLLILWLPLLFFCIPLNTNAQNGWVSYNIPVPGGGPFHFANVNTGMVVGKYVYYRTIDGGSTWSTDSVPYPHNFNDYTAVHFINANTGWLGMSYHVSSLAGGVIYKTTDRGTTWLSPVGVFSGVRAIKFLNDNTGYAATGSIPMFHTEGAVYKTTDGGTSWGSVGSAGYTVDVSFINVNTGWAIGFSGCDVCPQIDIMIKTTNGGDNWTTLINDTSHFYDALKRVQFIDQNTGYLIKDKLYKSTNGGVNWILLDTSLAKNLFFLNKDTGWVSRWSSGNIYRTNDGGATWSIQNTPAAGVNGSIQFFDALTGWAMANNTTLLKTGTGGVTSISHLSSELPSRFSLQQNYPNPFNPSTSIRFEIPLSVRGEKSKVKLSVYDIAGKEVGILVNIELQPGVYEYGFDGSGLGSGVYFYKLTTNTFSETKRMVLVK